MTVSLTKKPVIELKNIKYTAWMSEETHCYQATLYVDGQRWGSVRNTGRGGCDEFDGINGYGWNDIKELNKRIKETVPPYEYEGKSLDQDLEMICSELVNAWLRDQEFTKAMKSKVLFTKPEVAGIWQVSVKKPMTLWMLLDTMKAKHPQYTYLADLPVAEAKEIYFA
jgi:hypothetical protein